MVKSYCLGSFLAHTVFTELPLASHMKSKTELLCPSWVFQHVYMLIPRRSYIFSSHLSQLPLLYRLCSSTADPVCEFRMTLMPHLCSTDDELGTHLAVRRRMRDHLNSR